MGIRIISPFFFQFFKGFLVAWAIVYKEVWKKLITNYHDSIKEILSYLLPEMQPKWTKGMSTVILPQAIVSTS